MGRPVLLPAAVLESMSAEQVIEQVARHTAAAAAATYGLGLCLPEPAKPNRNADELGFEVAELAAADLNRALREDAASETENEAAQRASARLGEALRRADIERRMRTHAHGGLCVSAHLTPGGAVELGKRLARLRKLEKKQSV